MAETGPSDAERRLRLMAERTARKWAEKILAASAPQPDSEAAAIVLLDLLDRRSALEKRAQDAERLAFQLGGDMLYTLHTAYSAVDADGDPQTPDADLALLYLARGWKREGSAIALADCTEGPVDTG